MTNPEPTEEATEWSESTAAAAEIPVLCILRSMLLSLSRQDFGYFRKNTPLMSKFDEL